MKSILLTSTALVAFAGAAAADGHTSISHSLSGKVGYTDNTNINDPDPAIAAAGNAANDFGEDGFFWEGNLKTTATAALDNGLTAGAYFEITIAEDDAAATGDGGISSLAASDFVLSLESDSASLFFGDTGTAAAKHWASAGDMEQDGFTPDGDGSTAVLRGDVSFGGVDASVSYLVDDANNTVEQLSFGAAASFGAITLAAAYQEEVTSGFVAAGDDYNANEILGVSAAGTFAGATVTLAYAEQNSESSTGVKIAYPFGPVTATAYYVDESNGDANTGVKIAYESGPIAASVDWQDDQGVSKWVAEGSYDVGNGLTVLAGAMNENEGDDADYYVGGTYDLGGGAEILAVYATDVDGDQADEIGSGEYDPGTTIVVSFSF